MKDVLELLLPAICYELNENFGNGYFEQCKDKLIWIYRIDASENYDLDQSNLWDTYCDISEDLRNYKMYMQHPKYSNQYKLSFDAVSPWQDNDSCGFDVKIEMTPVAITHDSLVSKANRFNNRPSLYIKLYTLLQKVEGEFISDLFHMIKQFENSDVTNNGLVILSQKDQLMVKSKILKLVKERHKKWNNSSYVQVLDIENQAIMTINEAHMLERLIRMSMEAGYTHVRDHWGSGAYDEYTIEEALEKFRVKPSINNDDLPF